MAVLVDLEESSLVPVRIGAAPIVNRFLERLEIGALLDDYVPTDPRASHPPSVSLLVLVRSLAIERSPAYKITEWAQARDPILLGLGGDDPTGALNDDRLGRGLDALFAADRASMLTRLMCQAIRRFEISTDELHNDATTLSAQGEYSSVIGDSPRAPRVRFGHAKERPDLAQLIYLLTVSADGNVPITYRLADGNTPEDPTHIATWTACAALAGRTDFLYVSDAKLCSRDAMGHIDKSHGRFLTVMPATRAEVGEFRRFVAAGIVPWAEVARRPGRRRDSPEVVYLSTPAPSPSVEGYRIVWIRSSEKEVNDAMKRRRAIEMAGVALRELDEKLSGPRCRLKDERSVEAAAKAAIEAAGASRWVSAAVTTRTIVSHKQQKRGRPGPATVYVRVEEQRYVVAAVIADEVVRDDACFDGCWPLVTNDKNMSEAELFAAYKRQPGVENRHHVLKGVVDFVPFYLKSNERIDAFAFLAYIAVLIHALIERELRRAMRGAGIASLPLYPEDRACKMPTAARVIEIFEPLCAHQLLAGDEVVKSYEPALSSLHRQVLALLGISPGAYQPGRTTEV
jgi:transposase